MTTTAPRATSRRLRAQVDEDVAYLVDSWPALVTLRTPGSGRRRPPSRHEVTEAQRLRSELLAIQERVELRRARELGVQPVPPTGPIPAPAALEVLDLLAEFVAVSADVADAVTQTAGVERPPSSPSSSWTDPRPYLRLAAAWLEQADEVDERTVPWVAAQLRPLAGKVAHQLGEVHDGQLLDALCPWCGGRTERRLTGGERTLVVYVRGTRRAKAEGQGDGPVIVCRGLNCEPPEASCGTRVGGRPAWPEREWDWLARQLLPTTA